MSINNLNTYLNVRDAHLRVVSGNVYAQAMNIGGINVETAHGLQSVSNTGNATSLTLEFANVTTGFVTTANAQIGRDLVVTGNATVSKELTVTSNAIVSSNLNVSDDLVVTNNILASNNLTVTGNLNVTTVMSDSNVVTEYTGPHDRPLRKYPEVAMTSASQGGYVVTPSTQNGVNVAAYNMFDGDRSTRWRPNAINDTYDAFSPFIYNGIRASSISDTSGTTHDGVFLKLELPKAIKLDYTIIRENSDPASGTPGKITFLGSTNGTDWTFLKEFSGMTSTALDETYTINDTNYYNHFAFVVKNLSDASGELTLGEWELYGYEEGSGSLDTTLKSVYNVPATTGTQLDVYYDAKDLTTMPSTVTDLSGGDQNGTVAGHSPTLDNNSFVFDGVDDYITTTLTNPNTDWVHSASMWVYPTDISDDSVNGYIFAIGPEVSNQVSALRFRPDGFNYTRWQNGGAKIFNGPVTSGRWHHVTLVSPGSTDVQVYLDGRLLGYTSDSLAALTLPQNTSLSVGRFAASASYSRPFNGSIANFRLYSKALNADQVKELYDYQKDYFLGSKSQVTLYKGHLGVGVTEPSGQLELAGDERIQEYPPGPMDDYETLIPGHGVFCWYTPHYYQGDFETHSGVGMYAKDEGTTGWYGPYNGNSGYTGGNVYAGTDFAATSSSGLGFNDAYGTRYYGAWTTFKLPYKINLKGLRIRQWGTAESINSRCAPEDGVILGSNDGTKWYHVHTFTGLQYGGSAGSYSFSAAGEYVTINCNTDYNQYVLITTRTLHYAFTVIIGELRWFGTPGPTTLDKGSLSLGRSLDVPRVSRYDVDTETPRYEKLLIDYDTTVNSSVTDISGNGNHGRFFDNARYSTADKAFEFDGTDDYTQTSIAIAGGNMAWTQSMWFKINAFPATSTHYAVLSFFGNKSGLSGHIMSYRNNEFWQDWYGNGVKANYTLEVGKWYHVVSIYHGNTSTDANVRSSIYINGVKQTLVWYSQTSSPMTLPTSTFYELADYINTSNVRHNGWISNPKFYTVALEPSEVKKLYRLGRTGRSMVISDTAVGIGKAPEAQLDVRGNLNVDGVITNQQRPAFYVWRDGTGDNIEAIGHGGGSRLAVTGVITNWDSKRIDTAGTFDLSNGRYYIPVSGLYMFIGAGVYRYQSGNGILEASFYVNGSLIGPRGISYNRGNTTSEHHTVTITFMRFMNAGDYVQMGVPVAHSACDLYYGDNLGYFSGYLLG